MTRTGDKSFGFLSARRTPRGALSAILLIIAVLLLSASFLGWLRVGSAQAAIPKLVNFQGKLTKVSDGTNVANGTYAFEFKLYDALTVGTLLWTETYDQPSGACAKLAVTNGIFNVKLGSCNALTSVDFTSDSLYLSVNFAPTGTSYDGEMAPRKRLVAAAYAFNANNLVGDGRLSIDYAPADSLNNGARINYAPTVSSSKNALNVISGANVTGAGLIASQAGTGVGLELAGAGASARVIKSDAAALVLRTTTSGNITLDPQSGIVAGQAALTLQSGGANALTVDAGGAAGLNLGTGNANAVTISKSGVTTAIQGTITFNEPATVGNGAGNDYLGFAAEGTNPACAAGNYRVWANSSDLKLKKCQNGTITDLDTTGGGSATLQSAYDNTSGNTITTTDARNISITLADTATDSNFLINIATSSTSKFAVQSNATDIFTVTSSAITLAADTTLAAGKVLSAASGTGAFDFSAASGLFKTTTGAVTIGPGTTTLSGTAINLTGSSPVIDLTSATTLSINTTTNRPVTFGSGLVTTNGALTSTGLITANGGATVAANQNLTLSNGIGLFTQTHAPTTDATADAHSIILSAGGAASTGTLRGLVVSQADTGTVGVYDTLAYLENLKTPETTTNGLLITNNAASGALTNALHITNTAGTLTSAILIDGTAPGSFILDTASLDISGAGNITGVAASITGAGALTLTPAAASGLTLGTTGGGNTTSITLATDSTGDAEVVLPGQSISAGEILNDTITSTQLNAALTFSALDFVDLGLIVHNTTANQGLRLPNAASATPSNPTSGEGYLAWDSAGNQLITYNGTAWATVGGGSCSTCLVQAPTTTGQNTVTPTTASVVGLTVNATSSTAAIAAIFAQSQGGADAVNINMTNTAGTITNGLLINRNGTGGTTTNGLNIANTAGTLTTGILMSGTFINLIDTPTFDVSNAGTVTIAASQSYTGAGAVTVSSGGSSGLTIDSASNTLTIGSSDTILTASGLTTVTLGSGVSIDSAGNITLNPTSTVIIGAADTFQTDDITSAGALSLVSAAASNIALNPGTTGDVVLTHGDGSQFAINATPTTDTAPQDSVKITLNPTITGSTQTLQGLVISQSDNANTGVYDSLLKLENLKTPETTTNGLLIEQNAASGTLTNGIQVLSTAGTLTSGILIADGAGTTATGLTMTGTFTNLIDTPTFDVSNAGAITAVGVNSGTGLIQGTGGLTITGAAVSLNASSNFDANINTGTSTGTITIGNSSSTALKLGKFTTANGVLYISATDGTTAETAASTGAQCLQTTGAGTAPVWGACGSGGATAWDTIGDPAGAGAINFGQTVQTLDYTISTANASLFSFNFTNSGGTAGTDSGLVINNALSANTTGDLNTENLLLIQQLDTTAGGTTVVDNALKIDVAANSGITDGIEITNSAGNITNGINLIDTAGGIFTTGIVFSGTFTNLFDSGGTLITSTEFNRLDGTTAALVDQDDFISGDGVGGTSNGSGLEAGTGGIGLLQGCSDGQVLKWVEASSVWNCAADATGGGGTTTTITKSANQAATQSSITMQNVTELVFAMSASKTYIIEAYIPVDTSNATADLKYTVTVPTGATLNLFNNTYSTATAVITCNIIASATACTTIVNSAVNFIHMRGFVANGTTAGNFQVQFAQSTAAAASFPVIKKGSTLFYTPTAGADLAETYFTNDMSIAPGDVVSIDPALHTGVKKSTSAYDKNTLGIISTNPGLLLGEGGGSGVPVPVALAGRVPVKVSAENGAILPGDLLTSSSIPGVAMKATKAGLVIGQALTPFEGDGVSEVIVFVRNSYFYGNGVGSLLSGLTEEQAQPSSNELGKLALTKLIEQKEELAISPDLSEILTDRLAVGLEIIAPRGLFEGLEVDSIGALSDIITLTSDVLFFGRPYFNTDTAGFAVVTKGEKSVDIVFEKEYLEQPIANATITLETQPSASAEATEAETAGTASDQQLEELIFASDVRYIITKKSVNGFTIILNKPAPVDIRFSWTAFAVKNPKTFFSLRLEPTVPSSTSQTQSGESTSTLDQTPVLEPTPASTTGESVPTPTTNESVPATETAPISEPSPIPVTSEPVPVIEPAAESTLEPTPEPVPAPIPTVESPPAEPVNELVQ